MGIPEKIAIGPLVFRVLADDRSTDDKHGHIRYAAGEIILAPDQNEQHRRYTLLHEVMHGCWHIGDRSHKNDEKAIRSLAAPLLDVLRRNPDLVAYLTAIDEEP